MPPMDRSEPPAPRPGLRRIRRRPIRSRKIRRPSIRRAQRWPLLAVIGCCWSAAWRLWSTSATAAIRSRCGASCASS